MILAKDGDKFMQVLGAKRLGYVLEYRDGSPRRHYDSNSTKISEGRVLAAFRSYWEGSDYYEFMFEWKRIRV